MSFFKSLKGKMSREDEEHPNQSHHAGPTSEQKHTYQRPNNRQEPLHQHSDSYQPPPGPPPRQTPFHATSEVNPPPYESWLAVPDNSQLPPPPALGNEFSPANNASSYSAEMAHKWCAKNAIYTPSVPRNSQIVETSQAGELGFDPSPAGFRGSIRQLEGRVWEVKTEKKQNDTALISTLPVYFAAVSNPLLSSTQPSAAPKPVTFSFSVSINTISKDGIIAVGFICKPYPPSRLPGWHRGSVAIHSDDGNRYVNDPYGGIDFTRPLQQGETIRISMTIHPQASPVQEYHGKWPEVRRVGLLPKCVTEVQVERNARVEGRWQIHEERDGERDEGIEGLQGEADLYCTVGVSGTTGLVAQFEGPVF